MHSPVTPESAAQRTRLLDLLQGYRATCIVVTAIELGVLEPLRAGPASASELGDKLGAHLPSLQRFLRALEVVGLVEQHANGVALTSMGRLLIDPDAGLRDRAVLTEAEYLPAWLDLRHSVMTGEPAFPAVFGMSVWEHRKANPELGARFDRAMADLHARARRSVLGAYDFSGSRLVVDVGGGRGALMAEILKQYPHARGVVFDQPHVVEGARPLLTDAGVLDRCRATNSCPKIIHTNTDTEYSQAMMSLNTTDLFGKKDVVIPPEVRIYELSGTMHGGGDPTQLPGVVYVMPTS